jgi:hypothetical protein
LLWAARGGGPGFPGVILRYHLRLYSAPKVIMQCTYVYPLDIIEAIVSWLAETVPSLPSSVEQLLLLALPPPNVANQLDDRPQRYLTLWPVAYGNSAAETIAALAVLDTCPVLDRALVRQVNIPVTFDDLFATEAAVFPQGHRYDVGIIWSDADPTPVLSGLRDRLVHGPIVDQRDPRGCDRTAGHRSRGPGNGVLSCCPALQRYLQRLEQCRRRRGKRAVAPRNAEVARTNHARSLHGRN